MIEDYKTNHKKSALIIIVLLNKFKRVRDKMDMVKNQIAYMA